MPAEAHKILPSTDPSAVSVAVDVGSEGYEYQLIQNAFGPDGGAKAMVDDVDGKRLPVGGLQVGILTETAPATDTASSGLNGRLQRIAQRLSSLIGLLPTALGTNGGLKVDQAAPWTVSTKITDVSVTASVPVSSQTSNSLDCRGYRIVGIIVPSTFDGTQINFQVSLDGTNYFSLFDIANTQIVLAVTPSRAYPIPQEANEWSYFRVLTGAVQTTTTTDFQIQLRS